MEKDGKAGRLTKNDGVGGQLPLLSNTWHIVKM